MDIHKYLREGGNPDELEQHLMDLDSTFRFKCRRCGKCCKNQDTIIFTPRDIYNIAHKFGKSMEQVIEETSEVYPGRDSRMPIVHMVPRGPKNACRKCYRKTRRMKQSFGLYFFPGKGVRVMACKYLDFQDRKKIAKMYQEEARVLDIAYKIGCHPATIYEELRRGDTGKLDKNQRPEYDPRLAQRTFQEAIRRRGNRRTTTTAESGQ